MRFLLLGLLLAAAPALRAQTPNAITIDRYCLKLTGGEVRTGACAPGDNTVTLEYNRQRNAFRILTGSGYCLDGYRGQGQPAMDYQCDGTTDQNWWLNPSGQIQNQANNLCLDVEGGTGSGKRVLMWSCHGGANQRFAFGIVRPGTGSATTPNFAANTGVVSGIGTVSAGRIIATGGGTIIAAGGGNIIATGGGNLIGQASGN